MIAGKQVAEGDGQQIIVHSFAAEKLHADEKGCDRRVGHAAEEAPHAHGDTKRYGKSGDRCEQAAEGGADIKGGDDLAAFVAAGEGDGGKNHFQQKRCGKYFARFKAALDHVHAGAVVVGVSDKQREDNDDTTSGDGAQKMVAYVGAEKVCGAMEHLTENHADHGAEYGEDTGQAGTVNMEGGQICHREGLPDNMAHVGEGVGHKGGNHTGNKGGIVHNADADDFHGKDRGRDGRAKERGKAGAHAAHNHHALIIFVKTEKLSDLVADAGADL